MTDTSGCIRESTDSAITTKRWMLVPRSLPANGSRCLRCVQEAGWVRLVGSVDMCVHISDVASLRWYGAADRSINCSWHSKQNTITFVAPLPRITAGSLEGAVVSIACQVFASSGYAELIEVPIRRPRKHASRFKSFRNQDATSHWSHMNCPAPGRT